MAVLGLVMAETIYTRDKNHGRGSDSVKVASIMPSTRNHGLLRVAMDRCSLGHLSHAILVEDYRRVLENSTDVLT